MATSKLNQYEVIEPFGKMKKGQIVSVPETWVSKEFMPSEAIQQTQLAVEATLAAQANKEKDAHLQS